MLQQTTVAAVTDYYQRFLQQFPTVRDLADAPLGTVIDLWAGLGYYARARNLHAAAYKIVNDHDGVFPADVEALMALPGVGRSTAGAVAALAYDMRAPILDANVRRVLCRLFALQEPPRSSAAEKKLWNWAEALTPTEGVHDYTQAIMDLGALVCLPRGPRCDECPLEEFCVARRLKLVDQLPLKAVKKAVPHRRQLALLLVADGRCLVQRRPATGLLGGLWEFPSLDLAGQNPEAAVREHLAGAYLPGEIRLLGRARHSYSHFKLEVDFYRVEVQNRPAVAEGAARWLALDALGELALHGAHKKLLPLIGS